MARFSFWAGMGLLAVAGVTAVSLAEASGPAIRPPVTDRTTDSPAPSAPNSQGLAERDEDAPLESGGIQSLPFKMISCKVIEDAIIPLRPPTFTGVVEWKRTIGMEGAEHITDMMPLADGGVVAIGEASAYTKADGLKPAQLYVVRLAVTGKPVYEKRIDMKGFVNVAGGLVLKDRIIIASLVQDEKKKVSTQVTLIDGAGKVTGTFKIDDPARSVIPGDLIANSDGTSLTLAAMFGDEKDKTSTYTVLYRLGLDGSVMSKREFLPGVSTRIEQLQRLPDGNLAAGGRIRGGDDREMGWLLIVNRQGDLVLQRPYARGNQAQLIKVLGDGDGGLYTLGEAIPSDGGYRSAWVMRLDMNGNIKWQRFLRGKYRYAASDMVLQKDGRLMVMMAGRPAGEGGREHARIVTFASSGDMLHDEAYLEGSNAIPTKIMEHSVTKHRIVTGTAQTGFDNYGVPENQRTITYDAWFAGLTRLPTYTDPCKPAARETLDDDQ